MRTRVEEHRLKGKNYTRFHALLLVLSFTEPLFLSRINTERSNSSPQSPYVLFQQHPRMHAVKGLILISLHLYRVCSCNQIELDPVWVDYTHELSINYRLHQHFVGTLHE